MYPQRMFYLINKKKTIFFNYEFFSTGLAKAYENYGLNTYTSDGRQVTPVVSDRSKRRPKIGFQDR